MVSGYFLSIFSKTIYSKSSLKDLESVTELILLIDKKLYGLGNILHKLNFHLPDNRHSVTFVLNFLIWVSSIPYLHLFPPGIKYFYNTYRQI